SLANLRSSLKQSRVIQPLDETYEARGFFTDSQYPAYLAGRDAAELETLFTLQSPEQMIWLSAIIYQLISLGNSYIQTASPQTRAALNSFSLDPATQATLRPLRGLQNKASIKKYSLIFQALIQFLLRSYLSIDSGGPASYQGLYTLQPRQLASLASLDHFLQALPPPSESLAAYQPASFQPNDLSDTGSDTGSDTASSDNDTLPILPQASLDNKQISKGVGLAQSSLSLSKAASFEDIGNITNQWSFLSVYLAGQPSDFLLQKALASPAWTEEIVAEDRPDIELSRPKALGYLETTSN
ncbi:hypothetical protein N7478_007392, partial [Penicillium angulare]|uniref:uncharacterized protein n=1 Tax=Penicillium angulare TaxID=116970 RepID=UPI002540C586